MLYPLRFRPVFKHYLWGGQRLGTLLGKPIAPDRPCAESWEVVDRRVAGGEQSIVEFGPLAGTTLGELVEKRREGLLGRHASQPRFPLLVKFLDAQRDLSVQVHPDDARAALLDPPECGKTEAWVVMHADPGARIYAGLRPGVTRAAVASAIAQGTVENCLHSFTPAVGDCVFLPAGMIHALGAGLVVAEIQQSSDTTYRLYDWNRLGADGRPRELHLGPGLEALDDTLRPAAVQTPRPTSVTCVERLVECRQFIIDRWKIESAQMLKTDDRAHVLIALQGAVELERDPSGRPLVRGQTALVPAELATLRITPHEPCVLLDAYLP